MKSITLKHIRESNLIEGFDDSDFDKQGRYAWEYLSEQKELSDKVVKQVQKILTLKQSDLLPDERGYYRKVRVLVGNYEAPAPMTVPSKMAEWIQAMQHMENIDPKAAHVWFERIHPFVDGNGRTGRMLMWWHEIKIGREPTLILNSKKHEYYKWFGADDS